MSKLDDILGIEWPPYIRDKKLKRQLKDLMIVTYNDALQAYFEAELEGLDIDMDKAFAKEVEKL